MNYIDSKYFQECLYRIRSEKHVCKYVRRVKAEMKHWLFACQKSLTVKFTNRREVQSITLGTWTESDENSGDKYLQSNDITKDAGLMKLCMFLLLPFTKYDKRV